MIARYVPSLAEAVTRTFALGEASRLQSLFSEAGFADIETHTVRHTFVLPSFAKKVSRRQTRRDDRPTLAAQGIDKNTP